MTTWNWVYYSKLKIIDKRKLSVRAYMGTGMKSIKFQLNSSTDLLPLILILSSIVSHVDWPSKDFWAQVPLCEKHGSPTVGPSQGCHSQRGELVKDEGLFASQKLISTAAGRGRGLFWAQLCPSQVICWSPNPWHLPMWPSGLCRCN